MKLAITYNNSVFSLSGIKSGDAFGSGLIMTVPGVFEPGCTPVWDGMSPTYGNGEFICFEFDIIDAAATGSFPIVVSYLEGDIIDSNYESVDFTIYNGTITLS